MYRKLVGGLLEWKYRENPKPMILRGAGRVGKTWLMKEFGGGYYENFVYFSMKENMAMKEAFSHEFEIETILTIMEEQGKTAIEPENTLIILDDIQEEPGVFWALKYFAKYAPGYHVLAAGSMTEPRYHEGMAFLGESVSTLTLYPLDFEEFLYACGEKRMAEIFRLREKEWMHNFKDRYMDMLRFYYFVGGMPEAVKTFCQTRDMRMVREVHNRLLESCEQSFYQCASRQTAIEIQRIFREIPERLMEGQRHGHNIKQQYGEQELQWLERAGLVYRVNRICKQEQSLRLYPENDTYKLFLLDVGLMGTMAGLSTRCVVYGNQLFTEFDGILTEQYVMQQLKGNRGGELFYCATDTANGEIDFLIVYEDMVVPVEVQVEGNSFKKALKAYCNKYRPEVAIQTSLSDYGVRDWMVNIPLYGIGMWKKYIA